jgi:hypothetical protein
MMQFSKDINAPIYTAGTVHSLKSMNVNFSIYILKQLEDVPSRRMV